MKKTSVLLILLAAVLALAGCGKTKVTINGINDLTGLKIGVQTGTTGELWVQENVKDAKIASFKSGIDAALDLKTGAIDCVVIDELPAEAITARNPELAIIRDPFFEQNKEEYAIAVKKGNKAVLDLVNGTIKELKADGNYQKLINAFMPVDGNIVIPSITNNATEGEIKLGTNATFPPFEYVEGKDIVGFDITMGEYIAKKANVKLTIIDMAFDSLIPALQAGTIDFIAAGMSVTEERLKNVDFSDPYYASEQVIIIKK